MNPACFHSIDYPSSCSEFEVQAGLYHRLRALGLDVRGCVKSKCEDFGKFKNVFFDLVVFNGSTATHIIECKNKPGRTSTHPKSRQLRRYSKFGIPLIWCYNLEDIEKIIAMFSKAV
jgi:hypothetical protein